MQKLKNADFFFQSMAYLPGERPLVYPFEKLAVLSIPESESQARGFTSNLDVCGPGSAYIELGSGQAATKIIASVRGPRQQPINRSVFDVEVSYAPFVSYEKDSANDFSREIAAYVKEAIESSLCLDLYPQSAVTIYIKILQCGRSIHSVLAPAITVSSLACQRAGIKAHDKVIGVALGLSDLGDFVVNPADDITTSRPSATIGMWQSTRAVSFLHITGVISGGEDMIDSFVNVADSAVTEISNSSSI